MTNGNLSMEEWKVEMAKKFIQRSIFNDNYEELNEKQNDDAMKEVIQKSEDNNEESPRIKKEYSSVTQVLPFENCQLSLLVHFQMQYHP